MSWSNTEGQTSERQDRSQARRDDTARPRSYPSFGTALVNNAVNASPGALMTTYGVLTSSVSAALVGTVGLFFGWIGSSVKDFLDKRAESRAAAEHEAYVSEPRIDAGSAAALERAHELIAAVLRTVREVDVILKEIHDNLESSRERLDAAVGGRSNTPAELNYTYGHNLTATRLLERADRALDGAADQLGRFDMRTLLV